MAKMNSLVEPEVIRALYRASRAGVPVRLNVRGTCCLRPGIAGLSPTIEVVSIIDRYLEHSRVFYFHQAGAARLFISSADWMPRNLRRRVELLVPVEDEPSRRRLVALLETCFRDTRKSWRLTPDGTYERVAGSGRRRAVRSQATLYQEAMARVKDARQARRRSFEPYTAPHAEA
jgi:polyphosphate kinase